MMTGMMMKDTILMSLYKQRRVTEDSRAGTQDLKAQALKEDTQTLQANIIPQIEASQVPPAPAVHPSIVVMSGGISRISEAPKVPILQPNETPSKKYSTNMTQTMTRKYVDTATIRHCSYRQADDLQ